MSFSQSVLSLKYLKSYFSSNFSLFADGALKYAINYLPDAIFVLLFQFSFGFVNDRHVWNE